MHLWCAHTDAQIMTRILENLHLLMRYWVNLLRRVNNLRLGPRGCEKPTLSYWFRRMQHIVLRLIHSDRGVYTY